VNIVALDSFAKLGGCPMLMATSTTQRLTARSSSPSAVSRRAKSSRDSYSETASRNCVFAEGCSHPRLIDQHPATTRLPEVLALAQLFLCVPLAAHWPELHGEECYQHLLKPLSCLHEK
jgi:hypothetical protein